MPHIAGKPFHLIDLNKRSFASQSRKLGCKLEVSTRPKYDELNYSRYCAVNERSTPSLDDVKLDPSRKA